MSASPLPAWRIQVKARPGTCRDPKPLMKGLSAVVARPDCNALAIQYLRDVVRMNGSKREGCHTTLLVRRRSRTLSPGTSSSRSMAYR